MPLRVPVRYANPHRSSAQICAVPVGEPRLHRSQLALQQHEVDRLAEVHADAGHPRHLFETEPIISDAEHHRLVAVLSSHISVGPAQRSGPGAFDTTRLKWSLRV
jgi:hypothetical protein